MNIFIISLKLAGIFIFSYLIGCINPSYIVAKIKGFDIRQKGSHNAGASNAIITMGKTVGILSAIFDIFKAFICWKIAAWLFPEIAVAGTLAAVGCILGHIFPVFMKFKGGKGTACLSGTVLAFNPIVFLIFLVAEIVLVLATDYICVLPITVCIALPIAYLTINGKIAGFLILLIATVAIIYKHIENIKRIKNGTELHFSYLWKKDKEMGRLKSNLKEYSEDEIQNNF